MSGPTPNPSGCCGMPAACCIGGNAPDILTATVTGLCGSFSGTLIGQGSGAHSGCWVGSVTMQLKNNGFPMTCVSRTLNLTLCCGPMNTISLTTDCGGPNSGGGSQQGPVQCNPMDVTFNGVTLPGTDCMTSETTVTVEVKGQSAG